MSQFTASLTIPGDPSPLPATLEVEGGRLKVASGDFVIGDWQLTDIEMERIPEGFAVQAEGEALVLRPSDPLGFQAATDAATATEPKSSKRKRIKRDRAANKPSKGPESKPKAIRLNRPKNSSPVERQVASPATPVAASPTKVVDELSPAANKMDQLDQFLEKAEAKLGQRLPSWVFTRGGLVVIGVLLLVTVIFPTYISTGLVVAGLLLVVIGGVTYSDATLAMKLPGKITPTKLLTAGAGAVVVGVVVAIILN